MRMVFVVHLPMGIRSPLHEAACWWSIIQKNFPRSVCALFKACIVGATRNSC